MNGWNYEHDVALEMLDEYDPATAWDETVELVDFAPLPANDISGESVGIDRLLDINLSVTVELGRTNMTISEALALRSSSVIELDKLAGAPADILVNGARIAQGEVVVVDEKLGVRITELVSRAKRLASIG
jgi:flagellar motor switch protein FliN